MADPKTPAQTSAPPANQNQTGDQGQGGDEGDGAGDQGAQNEQAGGRGRGRQNDGRGGERAQRMPYTQVEIEFGDNRNRCVLFPMTAERYRGAWKRENLIGDEMVEEIAGMPDIPGMRLLIDPQRRKAAVYDPLALPANAELCKRVQVFVKKLIREDQGPAQPSEHQLKDDTAVKSWLYWARRMVDAKRARVTTGTLPTIEDIEKLAGKTRIESWNSSARACKFKEDQEDYIDFILSQGARPRA